MFSTPPGATFPSGPGPLQERAAPPPARDDPAAAAREGIRPALSEGLSHVIVVQPLGAQPPGIGPLGLREDAPAHSPDHVIDIRLPPPVPSAAGPLTPQADPQDHVIDIREPAGDEDAPESLEAPARMARDGSQRLLPGVRFAVPPDTVPAVRRAARQAGASAPEREVVTPAETWRVAARMGLEQAACGFLTQLAGRTVGLAVTSALRRSEAVTAFGVSLGAILAGNLAFGARTATLITRALGLEEPPRHRGPGQDAARTAAAQESHLDRAACAATALTVVPLLTQALLPMLGTYFAGTGVGVKIAATIVGRLTAALVRDGLTQSVAGLMSSVEVVTASGKRPDPSQVRDQLDPLRIRLAVALYTLSSGIFLLGTSDPLADAIAPGSPQSFAQLVHRGMGAVLASSFNEGIDGLLPSLARAGAAIELDLRLVPRGWQARRAGDEAQRGGHRPPAEGGRRDATPPPARTGTGQDLARRIQAHAGMRMTFGTFTADPWNAIAEILGMSTPAGMMLRTVGAILNGQTGRRGYTVELGNQPTQVEIDIRNLKAQERTDRKLAATHFMNTRADAQFAGMREDLRQAFRARLLASGAIPEDDPDRALRLEQLDLAIEESAGTWLDSLAEEALKQQRRHQIRSEHQGPYHFVVSSVVNEGEMIEADSLQGSTSPSEAPSRGGPPGLVSQQVSPLPPVRRLPRVDAVPAGPPALALRPQDLRAGQAIRLDGEAVRFIRLEADGSLQVRAHRAVQSLGWAPALAEGDFAYSVSPIAIASLVADMDDGMGTGLRPAEGPAR